ncbi:glycine/D-amino acid oxidase-like deaminating enzyme [Tamaricihabitans halophyticus]|uniref:Glycine/D-amino acid oxidase-like deaminating enzyme n=1 Tax=Tamaricihabitans halophyticus TaxID=1262583 RepID=A0A4R2R286_9PSEU|nr:FAD-dependent oxidoreductase [Tamaricihabitans halophyticus]TCP56840.1 glycine/D-amino acid oxidase-like deaminating enzyme [Tamaricihabitans halophyticus]
MDTLRDAEFTIIGGGAIGCAVAYHLAEAGYTDVQLLEAGELAGATTSKAAGLVGQVRTSAERTRLAMASVRLFTDFARRTGYPVDWRQTGSIRIAYTEPREQEFHRMAAVAESVGLGVEFLAPARLAELVPGIDTSRVRAALHCPTDGYLQPHSLTTAYARAARDRGVRLVPHAPVRGIAVRDGAVCGVRTDAGEIRTETVINAAGPWAHRIAAMVGLDLPIVPVRHQYYVTEPVDGWHPELPVLRIPDARLYVRAEISGVLCGGWEANADSRDPRELTGGGLWPCPPDWDVLAGFAGDLAELLPGTAEAGPREVFRGWPAFTPDGRFVVGPVPGLRGFVFAAGCNAHGVSGSAGLAEHVLASMRPDPSPYVASLSPRRFMSADWTWAQAEHAARGVYQDYYAGLAAAAQGG